MLRLEREDRSPTTTADPSSLISTRVYILVLGSAARSSPQIAEQSASIFGSTSEFTKSRRRGCGK
jgi:hypothetical protein